MAKKIEWTQRSVIDRIQIYEYWLLRNKSDRYSKRLEIIFTTTANLLSEFPLLGTRTTEPNLRVKVVRSFKIFYLDLPDKIQILRIRDTRQAY